MATNYKKLYETLFPGEPLPGKSFTGNHLENDDTFVEELLNVTENTWEDSLTAKEINDEIFEVITEFYKPILEYGDNKKNMAFAIKYLNGYMYIRPGETIQHGYWVKVINKRHQSDSSRNYQAKLQNAGIALADSGVYVSINRKSWDTNTWRIFTYKHCNYHMFIKMKPEDKLRSFLNELEAEDDDAEEIEGEKEETEKEK